MTGDTELDDFQELQMSHIVFTTPVSWHNVKGFSPDDDDFKGSRS